MHKIIYIAVLTFILSLFVVCAPEQSDIIEPKQKKTEGSQRIIIANTNNTSFSIFKTEHRKINSENILVSSLNNNLVLPFIYSFSDISKQTTNNKVKELDEFNKVILNLDKEFVIKEQTKLSFNKAFDFQKNFIHFLEKNKDYKINFTHKQVSVKNMPFVKIQNNVEAKFIYSHQTDISEAPFYLSPDKSKFIEMIICEGTFNYYSNNYMKAVEVPIGQGNFSAIFFIPETNFSLDRIVKVLNPYILQTVQNNYRKLQLSVYIPMLNIYNRRESNSKNYYANPIDIKTKLKNISKKSDVTIKNIIYETALKSISKIKYKKKLNKSSRLFIDRPFVFIIQEKYTGTIVFIGQIVNP